MCMTLNKNNTCDIYTPNTTTNYGGRSADSHTLSSSGVSCTFRNKPGKLLKQDISGRDITYSAILRIETEIVPRGMVVIGGYEWDILQVDELKDMTTDTIQYYRGYLERRREHNEDTITIS